MQFSTILVYWLFVFSIIPIEKQFESGDSKSELPPELASEVDLFYRYGVVGKHYNPSTLLKITDFLLQIPDEDRERELFVLTRRMSSLTSHPRLLLCCHLYNDDVAAQETYEKLSEFGRHIYWLEQIPFSLRNDFVPENGEPIYLNEDEAEVVMRSRFQGIGVDDCVRLEELLKRAAARKKISWLTARSSIRYQILSVLIAYDQDWQNKIGAILKKGDESDIESAWQSVMFEIESHKQEERRCSPK